MSDHPLEELAPDIMAALRKGVESDEDLDGRPIEFLRCYVLWDGKAGDTSFIGWKQLLGEDQFWLMAAFLRVMADKFDCYEQAAYIDEDEE